MFAHDGLYTTLFVLRRGDRLLILCAVTYYAFDVAAFGVVFQAFGCGAPPVAEFVLAYTIGHVGALLPTPGGVRGTEGGLIGMMVVYGAPVDVATAVVLAYRVFQLGLPAILGALSMLRIRALLADEFGGRRGGGGHLYQRPAARASSKAAATASRRDSSASSARIRNMLSAPRMAGRPSWKTR